MNGIHTIHSKQIRVGNLDIRYFTGGKGEPLVVVHGDSGGGAKEWLENMTELCQHFTVYVPALPGFGLSQRIDGDHGINEFVEFLDDFTSCVGLETFYLAGHSIGGGIALRYAVKSRHKVKKLVLINGIGVGKDIALWVRLMSSSTLCRSLGVAAATILRAVKWAVNVVYAPIRFMNPLPVAAVLLGASMTIFRQEAAVLVPPARSTDDTDLAGVGSQRQHSSGQQRLRSRPTDSRLPDSYLRRRRTFCIQAEG